MKNKTLKRVANNKGFTLIEMLVVITIIGVLLSITVPAVSTALDKVYQMSDRANAKSIVTILLSDATENAGVFRTTQEDGSTPISSSTDLFKGLAADGTLTALKVIAGTGLKPATSTNNITSLNIAWDYGVADQTGPVGLSTSDSQSPIIISYGAISGQINDTNVDLSGKRKGLSTGALWGDIGVVIAYVGGNAEFLKTKANNKSVALPESATNTYVFSR